MTFRIPIDTPALFLNSRRQEPTASIPKRQIKKITCEAIDEAHTFCGFAFCLRDYAESLSTLSLKTTRHPWGNFNTKVGNANATIGTRYGNMIPTFFLLPVNPSYGESELHSQ